VNLESKTMANNTRARLPVKWIRDMNKTRYQKGDSCAICGTSENIEFHHYYSLTLLFEKWVKANNLTINNDDDVLNIREQFSNEHKRELFGEVVDLCKAHHARLHDIYGVTPLLHTAEKQKRWVGIQAEKHGIKYEFVERHEGVADRKVKSSSSNNS
jgi:hypothetical protein